MIVVVAIFSDAIPIKPETLFAPPTNTNFSFSFVFILISNNITQFQLVAPLSLT
jgi:hypothetical protein